MVDGDGEENGESALHGHGILVGEDEVLETAGAHACVTTGVFSVPLNCTLRVKMLILRHVYFTTMKKSTFTIYICQAIMRFTLNLNSAMCQWGLSDTEKNHPSATCAVREASPAASGRAEKRPWGDHTEISLWDK